MGLFGPKTLIYDQNERNKQGTGGLRETTEHFPRATARSFIIDLKLDGATKEAIGQASGRGSASTWGNTNGLVNQRSLTWLWNNANGHFSQHGSVYAEGVGQTHIPASKMLMYIPA